MPSSPTFTEHLIGNVLSMLATVFFLESREIPIGCVCINYQEWKILRKSFYQPLVGTWHYTQRRLKSIIHFKIVLLSPVYDLRVQVAA